MEVWTTDHLQSSSYIPHSYAKPWTRIELPRHLQPAYGNTSGRVHLWLAVLFTVFVSTGTQFSKHRAYHIPVHDIFLWRQTNTMVYVIRKAYRHMLR